MVKRRLNAQRGLFAASALLAALLVGTAAWSHLSISAASSDLAQGRGNFLAEMLKNDLGSPYLGPPDLQALIDRHPDVGILWVGRVRFDGTILEEAGTRPTLLLTDRDEIFGARGDVGVYVVPPPRWPRAEERSSEDAPPSPPPPSDPLDDGDHARLEVAYTLAPVIDLVQRSQRALGVAIAGALLLTGVSLASWRALLRTEEAERQLNRHRQLAELGQVFAVLAHEVRNPLSAVKGHAQLLAELLPTEDRLHARAARVVAESERLERLMEDLLAFAREARLERVEADPTALATRVAEELDPTRIEVKTVGPAGPWRLDPDRMQQVLNNLVTNALQAGSGPILIEVHHASDALTFSVRDHGPGLDPADLERIFEPFVTLRARGTGLGLAVARRFVGLHGGTLTASNHPEGGALFVARIPALG